MKMRMRESDEKNACVVSMNSALNEADVVGGPNCDFAVYSTGIKNRFDTKIILIPFPLKRYEKNYITTLELHVLSI